MLLPTNRPQLERRIWNPNSFPQTQLNLAFENANIAGGNFSWTDTSGLGRHYTQANLSSQPTINSDGITFSGSQFNSIHCINNIGLLNNVSAATFGIVLKRPAGGANSIFYISTAGNTNTTRALISIPGAGFRFSGRRLDSETNVTDITRNTSLLPDTFYILLFQIDYTNATINFRMNGASVLTTSFITPGNTSPTDPIRSSFGRGNNTTTSWFTGTVSDAFLAHSNNLEEAYKLEAYFANRRKLKSLLPTNHPYKYSNP